MPLLLTRRSCEVEWFDVSSVPPMKGRLPWFVPMCVSDLCVRTSCVRVHAPRLSFPAAPRNKRAPEKSFPLIGSLSPLW